MDVFLAFLPLTFLLETIVYNTCVAIESLGELPLGWGEFLHFIGLGVSCALFQSSLGMTSWETIHSLINANTTTCTGSIPT
jgi:hypothetical protein